jgi:hypothetical protein
MEVFVNMEECSTVQAGFQFRVANSGCSQANFPMGSANACHEP